MDEEMSGEEPVTEAVMEEEEGVKKGPGLGFILGKLSLSKKVLRLAPPDFIQLILLTIYCN